jgi:hypothetical protein
MTFYRFMLKLCHGLHPQKPKTIRTTTQISRIQSAIHTCASFCSCVHAAKWTF